jgi:putative tryptophan/tyrosine transport system substrate-binding protein
MAIDIGRREFISALGGAAVAWPLAASAQQPALPVVGFLGSRSANGSAHLVTSFHQGLKETGYVDGQNLVMEIRWAEGHYDRLPEMAADLVRRQVAVIAATGSPNSAQAARAATRMIPIVFATGGDPVKLGLVVSLNRPSGNATGISFFNGPLGSKRLELLHKLVPTAAVIGFLVNPNDPRIESDIKDLQTAASVFGAQIVVLKADSETAIDAAIAGLTQRQANALIVNADSFFSSRNKQIVALAARYVIPTIYSQREYITSGGLVSYGTNLEEGYREAGTYVGRILKGAKPAELPVLLPTKFELVINLKTAKALDITVPPTLLALADEVIE